MYVLFIIFIHNFRSVGFFLFKIKIYLPNNREAITNAARQNTSATILSDAQPDTASRSNLVGALMIPEWSSNTTVNIYAIQPTNPQQILAL